MKKLCQLKNQKRKRPPTNGKKSKSKRKREKRQHNIIITIENKRPPLWQFCLKEINVFTMTTSVIESQVQGSNFLEFYIRMKVFKPQKDIGPVQEIMQPCNNLSSHRFHFVVHYITHGCKGQLISECPFEILDFPKIPRKI